jgi:predicted metal-dependent hydrolase
MKFDWTQGALAEGLRLYDADEFFAAHEAWESVWLGLQEPDKTFLQGLLQVTAAFYHLQRNNPLGTALLLQAALRRLERYPARFGGISVTLRATTFASGYWRSKRANRQPNSFRSEYDPASVLS